MRAYMRLATTDMGRVRRWTPHRTTSIWTRHRSRWIQEGFVRGVPSFPAHPLPQGIANAVPDAFGFCLHHKLRPDPPSNRSCQNLNKPNQ